MRIEYNGNFALNWVDHFFYTPFATSFNMMQQKLSTFGNTATETQKQKQSVGKYKKYVRRI